MKHHDYLNALNRLKEGGVHVKFVYVNGEHKVSVDNDKDRTIREFQRSIWCIVQDGTKTVLGCSRTHPRDKNSYKKVVGRRIALGRALRNMSKNENTFMKESNCIGYRVRSSYGRKGAFMPIPPKVQEEIFYKGDEACTTN